MPSDKQITRRQREFLCALVAIWRENNTPVHYSAVAERMGVNRFSAYDMLQVLQAKGFIAAQYVVDHSSSPAGRSCVYYVPTPEGLREAQGGVAATLAAEWAGVRDHLLSALKTEGSAGRVALLDELLRRIPRRKSPLVYCGEVIAALLLNLSEVRQKVAGRNPLSALQSLTGSSGSADLTLVAGLSLGAGMALSIERRRLNRLTAITQRYQELLSEVGHEGRMLLASFLHEAMEVLGLGESSRGVTSEQK